MTGPTLLTSLTLTLPAWFQSDPNLQDGKSFSTLEDRMRLAIHLSRQNVEHRTGGPFGSAIFVQKTGELIAVGVNQVVPLHNSTLHAEMVALQIAEQKLANYDLSSTAKGKLQLFTSSQPCGMCMNGIHWSGIEELVIGASKEDVERITGLDEGLLPDNWVDQLNKRSPLPPCAVVQDVLRDEASTVLQLYVDTGGFVYNPTGRSRSK